MVEGRAPKIETLTLGRPSSRVRGSGTLILRQASLVAHMEELIWISLFLAPVSLRENAALLVSPLARFGEKREGAQKK